MHLFAWLMSNTSHISIATLLIGNIDRPEFSGTRRVLDTAGPVLGVCDVDSAIAAVEETRIAPELIVLAQAFPGEFSRAQVERLCRLAPLARVVGLLGSWCEGEVRTGSPWPAVVRVYWHQWPARSRGEIKHWRQGTQSVWGLPITATEEERLLYSVRRPLAKRDGVVAIHTARYEMEEWLSAACRQRGYATVWLRPPRPARIEGARAVVFDGTDGEGAECHRLRHLAGAVAPTPLIVLLDFPRVQDRRRVLSAGAAAVLSKPLDIDDLFGELDRLTRAVDEPE